MCSSGSNSTWTLLDALPRKFKGFKNCGSNIVSNFSYPTIIGEKYLEKTMLPSRKLSLRFFSSLLTFSLLTLPYLTNAQDVEQLLKSGIEAGENSNFAEAERIFNQIIAIDPNNAQAYYNLGTAQYDQGKLEEARVSYRKAIVLNPLNTDAYINLGSVLSDLGQFAEAVSNFEMAIQIDPKSSLAYNNLGTVLQQQGQLDRAKTHYQKAIQLDRNNALAYYNLGLVLKAQGETEAAADYFRRALELDPNLPDPSSTTKTQ